MVIKSDAAILFQKIAADNTNAKRKRIAIMVNGSKPLSPILVSTHDAPQNMVTKMSAKSALVCTFKRVPFYYNTSCTRPT